MKLMQNILYSHKNGIFKEEEEHENQNNPIKCRKTKLVIHVILNFKVKEF